MRAVQLPLKRAMDNRFASYILFVCHHETKRIVGAFGKMESSVYIRWSLVGTPLGVILENILRNMLVSLSQRNEQFSEKPKGAWEMKGN